MGIQTVISNVIKKFAELEEDWNGYGALPITQKAIDRAIQLLEIIAKKYPHAPLPLVYPVNDGGIDFEWETCSSRLTHWNTAKNKYVYMIIDTTIDKDNRKFTAHKVTSIDKMLEVFDSWINQC